MLLLLSRGSRRAAVQEEARGLAREYYSLDSRRWQIVEEGRIIHRRSHREGIQQRLCGGYLEQPEQILARSFFFLLSAFYQSPYGRRRFNSWFYVGEPNKSLLVGSEHKAEGKREKGETRIKNTERKKAPFFYLLTGPKEGVCMSAVSLLCLWQEKWYVCVLLTVNRHLAYQQLCSGIRKERPCEVIE